MNGSGAFTDSETTARFHLSGEHINTLTLALHRIPNLLRKHFRTLFSRCQLAAAPTSLLYLIGIERGGDALGVGGGRVDAGALDLQ